jgi:hypothetical protein
MEVGKVSPREKKEDLCQVKSSAQKWQTCRKAGTQSYGSKRTKVRMIAEPPRPIVILNERLKIEI